MKGGKISFKSGNRKFTWYLKGGGCKRRDFAKPGPETKKKGASWVYRLGGVNFQEGIRHACTALEKENS